MEEKSHRMLLLSGSREATRLTASAPSAMIQAASTAHTSVMTQMRHGQTARTTTIAQYLSVLLSPIYIYISYSY